MQFVDQVKCPVISAATLRNISTLIHFDTLSLSLTLSSLPLTHYKYVSLF